MAQKYDIFISYRRKGGVQDARLVDEKLRNSGYSVSFDIDTLGRGKFTDTLKARLKDCKDFIVIFEPTYYERFYDENGKVKPEEALNEDWCYLELKNALQMNKNIIPLVPKDFVFPNNLPRDVKDVAEMNAIQLTEKEFKEIFEYKVKSYLLSKPKFTYRYRKPIIAVLSLMILAIIAYLVSFGLESQKKAAEEAAKAKAESERAALVADSIKKAGEDRAAYVADSIGKLGEARSQSILDSIKAKEAKEAERRAAASTSQKTELYWVGNGDETGERLFRKLSGAGLKTGKCSGNGIKVTASSKPLCGPSPTGGIKCTYTPQLIAANCSNGSQVDKLIFGQAFIGSSKEQNSANQKILESLDKANFSDWVNKLKSLRR